MKKVYAVNSGSYSDYRVDAIFSTRELAKKFMQDVESSAGYNDIEVYELDPPVSDLIKRGYCLWLVHMLIDGTTEKIVKDDVNTYSLLNMIPQIWRRSKAPAYKGTNTPDILTSTVWAKTEQQAVKIVNEQRTQLIAEGKWK